MIAIYCTSKIWVLLMTAFEKPDFGFRKEAIESRYGTDSGGVIFQPRISHTVLTCVVVVLFIACVLWVVNSTYTSHETVSGWIAPSNGWVRVYGTPGTVRQISVSEGDHVKQGDQLFVIISEKNFSDSDSGLENRLLTEYQRQSELYEKQLEEQEKSLKTELERVELELKAELKRSSNLEEQIKLKVNELALLDKSTAAYEKLRIENMVSEIALNTQKMKSLSLASSIKALEGQLIDSRNKVTLYGIQKQAVRDQKRSSWLETQMKISNLLQQIDQVKANHTHVVRATRSGYIYNLQVDDGMKIPSSNQSPLVTIIDHSQNFEAVLLVPVKSAGFLKEGQKISIRYDAYPYQKYGLHGGRITTVSKGAYLPGELISPISLPNSAVFRVVALLDSPFVRAGEGELVLKPGMTLTTDIDIKKSSIIEWIFEPVIGLRERL